MTARRCLALGLVACLVLLWTASGPGLRADERDAGWSGLWAFDVRVVRVDPPTKEGAEAPCALDLPSGGTVATGWTEVLAELKARGATLLLMDQRITCAENGKCVARSDRTVPIVAVNFRSKADEQLRAANVKTGCEASLAPTPSWLDYAVQVRWTLTPPADAAAPQSFQTEWNGTYPNFDGRTLVLHYREQVREGEGTRAVEIYALITARRVTDP